jgi:PBP4 family serine-type D-alanyl-D-alanine carboxypeptidase
MKGDLILVASGDPNLSNRIQPDGTLAFVDVDHSYGGPAVKGDPLAIIRKLAREVAASGIKKIEGRVLVDSSLFPDSGREGGTNVVISSIAVNDNLIDLRITPGAKAADAALLVSSPQTSYARFVNQVMTSAAGSKQEIGDPEVVTNLDGTVEVILSGNIPLGAETMTLPFAVPSPTTFAETVLREALNEAGIAMVTKKKVKPRPAGFLALSRNYFLENQVAEHISPPLAEEIKITLKVSQNLHASMGPYLLGALRGKKDQDILKAGFEVERAFLQDAKLELSGASQGDGEGTDVADLFSPEFIVHYLAYWATRADFQTFFGALPILGKDGTLAKIQVESPAAGNVRAKTGTAGSGDRLNGKVMLNGKGLAGYLVTKSGQRLAFAAYVNHVSLPSAPEIEQQVAGQALGEIAAAAYDSDLPGSAASNETDRSNSSR